MSEEYRTVIAITILKFGELYIYNMHSSYDMQAQVDAIVVQLLQTFLFKEFFLRFLFQFRCLHLIVCSGDNLFWLKDLLWGPQFNLLLTFDSILVFSGDIYFIINCTCAHHWCSSSHNRSWLILCRNSFGPSISFFIFLAYFFACILFPNDVPMIYISCMKAKISVTDKDFWLTLIARRSRHYAGTRFLFIIYSLVLFILGK